MTTKIFFDTEFTGLHQETTLISFGAIQNVEKHSMRNLQILTMGK